jgi:hypothetical protein
MLFMKTSDVDPWNFSTDPDSDPAIFVTDTLSRQDLFLLITFWRHIYILFQR